MDVVKRKIAKWNDMNISFLKEINSLVQEIKVSKSLQIICYFTYSFNISHMRVNDNFCLGSFHMYNNGAKPLQNPYICIKLSSNSSFEFSGKYVYKDSKQKINLVDTWERINDPKDKQEYWLKPNNLQELNPLETLSFSDFQIKWSPESSYTGSVLGFVYGDELKEGISALNQINVSGQVDEEDTNE